MKCFTRCFRTDSNHKKIITKRSCHNSISSCNKINSISPQALQDLLETHENGEAFVAIDDTNEEDNHHDDEIVKSINFIEESKEIISRENLLEFDENGEAINAKREEARRKIVNCTNLFEESKDDEEEEEEELNQSNNKNLFEASKNDDDLLVSANWSDKIYPSNLQKQNREEEEEETNEVSNSSVSSYISYPQNHRYHSNDGFQDIDLEDEANNNGYGNEMTREESSYESLFSLSIDNSTRRGNNPLPEILCDKEEVNSPLKPTLLGRFQNADGLVLDRPEVVHLSSSFKESEQHRLKRSIKFSATDRFSQLSILNPIRNPRLFKDTGIATPTSLLKQQEEKENLLDFTTTCNRAKKENEIGVDTSLSSWLVDFSPDDTLNSENSVGSVGNSPSERRVGLVDRPILGALTVEEIKDEKAIVIGTVGSYLRRTGQATGISSSM